MARRAGARRRLAQDERALRQHRPAARPTSCAPRRRPTPAGPASTTTPACRASGSRRCCCIARRTTSARSRSPTSRPACSTSIEEVDREIPLKGRRWVVSHVNVFSPRDIEQIARMGLVLTHAHQRLSSTRRLAAPQSEAAAGAACARSRRCAICSMPASSVGLATDNVPVSLFWPVWQSIARQDRVTNERVSPEQALTRAEALRCATHQRRLPDLRRGQEGLAGARQARRPRGAQRRSAHRGGRSTFATSPRCMTMVGGRIVHETPNWFG